MIKLQSQLFTVGIFFYIYHQSILNCMKKSVFLAVAVVVLLSCKSKIVPTENKTEPILPIISEKSATDMVDNGESIYKSKCGNCHDLPNVKAYTPQNWKPILQRMQKQADLSDAQIEAVYQYIVMQ